MILWLVNLNMTSDQGYLSSSQITAVALLALCCVKMPRNPHTLSEREQQAIEFKVGGHNNTNIAKRLRVSHVAIGKYFKKPLVRDCLERYIESSGKEFYPLPVYANREAKRAAKTNDQRANAFKNWLTQRLVDMGTDQTTLAEDLKQIVQKEAKRFWLGYLRKYEPELTKKEIEYFFRQE